MPDTATFDDAEADRTRDHTPPAAATPAPPTAPPGYRIVGELGRGGMGVVYDAVQTTLNRPCALKMVLGSGHAGSVALIRFLAEAEAVAAIDHPHVVRVFEFGNHDGHPFLAMERLDGGSLADRLKASGPLPVADAVALLERVAAGVQAGHDLGIVHRDLKPANILLASDGTPKVTDFGLAKRDSGGDLTATNAMMGTPEYMSPEQAKGQTKFVGPTADVYSLGAILYAALSGRPPFQCPSVYDLRLKVIHEDAPSLSKFAPSVPRDLAVIAAKCLAKDAAERYPTAAAFADDLRRWRTGDTIVARAASNQERAWKAAKRNRGLVAAVGTVVVALCVGMVSTSVAAVRALAEAKRADEETAKAVEAAERADGEAKRADGETTKAVRAAERADGEARKATEEATKAVASENYAKAEKGRADEQADKAKIAAAEANTEKSKALAQAERAEKQLERAERLTYASQVSQADRVFRKGDVISAIRFLRTTRWDFRGWEYDYFTTKPYAGHATLTGHTAPVTSVAFNPDSSCVASGSEDHTVRLWDGVTGLIQRTLIGHVATVTCVAFGPKGTRVASGSQDNTVRLWDAASGHIVSEFAGHKSPVRSVTFSPNGKSIVSAGEDNTIRLWNVDTGRERAIFVGHTDSVTCVAFSPDGMRVASGSNDNTVRIWDAATGIERRSHAAHRSWVTCLAFSPDGMRVVSGGYDKNVLLWDATGHQRRTLLGHTQRVTAVAFSPDGTRVASAGQDRTVRVWDATSGREQWTFTSHTGSFSGVAFSLDGTRVVAAGEDCTVRMWDTVSGHAEFVFTGPLEKLSAVKNSPDKSRVASVGLSNNNTVLLTDAITGREQGTLTGHTEPVLDFAFNPDGTRLASASGDNTVKVWDIFASQELCSFEFSASRDAALRRTMFSPNGCSVILIGQDNSQIIFAADTQSYECTLSNISASLISGFVLRDWGYRLVAKSGTGEMSAWSLKTGQSLRDETVPADLTFVTRADLPDGKRVAFVEGGKVVVRDKAKYAAFQAEMARRLAEYAKPKPEWHARSFDEARAAKDWFAARFHLGYLRKIRGDSDLSVRWRAAKLPAL